MGRFVFPLETFSDLSVLRPVSTAKQGRPLPRQKPACRWALSARGAACPPGSLGFSHASLCSIFFERDVRLQSAVEEKGTEFSCSFSEILRG